jgi:hypothetical protein
MVVFFDKLNKIIYKDDESNYFKPDRIINYDKLRKDYDNKHVHLHYAYRYLDATEDIAVFLIKNKISPYHNSIKTDFEKLECRPSLWIHTFILLPYLKSLTIVVYFLFTS